MRYLNLLKDWFPLGLATVYILGFVVVGFHLAGYGASSLDLIKAQYLAAGFWFCCASLGYFGVLSLIRSIFGALLKHRQSVGFRQSDTLGNLLFSLSLNFVVVLAGGLIVLFVYLVPPPGENRRETATVFCHNALLSTPFVLSMAFLDISFRLRDWFKKKAGDEEHRNENWMMAWATATLQVVFISLLSINLFAISIYRFIPFSFGGGQPRQVVFWLGAGTGPADFFLERDDTKLYSVPYELLVESESSLVLISPKDGQRAIEFDRKAVGAVVVLGKRPWTAPAHFQRGVTERKPGTNSAVGVH